MCPYSDHLQDALQGRRVAISETYYWLHSCWMVARLCPDVKYLNPRKCPDPQSKPDIFLGLDALHLDILLGWKAFCAVSLRQPERLSGLIYL